jgi:hypothetical protein
MTHRVESIFGDWIAFEELWDIDLEAVTSKIVGKELRRPCQSRFMEGRDDVHDCFEARGQRRPTHR